MYTYIHNKLFIDWYYWWSTKITKYIMNVVLLKMQAGLYVTVRFATWPALKPTAGLKASWHDSWLNWLLTRFKTKRSAGAVAESKNKATYHECIRAVARALQSWCLIKLSRGLLFRYLDLALETVSNGTFVEIVKGWLSLPSTCCDSSPASCWIKLSCLPSSLWSL